jgi:hypothetical protein
MTTRQMAVLEIQTAIQSRLTGDTTLMAMITGVFADVREGQVPPYISYGQHVDGPWPTFGKLNSEAYIWLHIWSKDTGDEECYRILAELIRLLPTSPSNPPLTLPSYSMVRLWYEWSTILYDPEFSIRHMPVRFLAQATEM